MVKWIQNFILVAILFYLWYLIFSDVQQITTEEESTSIPSQRLNKKDSIEGFADSLLEINPFSIPHLPIKKSSTAPKKQNQTPPESLDLRFIGELVFPDKKTRIYSFSDGNGMEYSIQTGDTILGGWIFVRMEKDGFLFMKNRNRIVVSR